MAHDDLEELSSSRDLLVQLRTQMIDLRGDVHKQGQLSGTVVQTARDVVEIRQLLEKGEKRHEEFRTAIAEQVKQTAIVMMILRGDERMPGLVVKVEGLIEMSTAHKAIIPGLQEDVKKLNAAHLQAEGGRKALGTLHALIAGAFGLLTGVGSILALFHFGGGKP